MNSTTRIRCVFALLACLALPVAAVEPIYSDGSDQAISGYDPVAYFSKSRAVKGRGDLTYQWNGAEWLFSSEQNRELFKNDPEKYAPQFGGYCAWAVSRGYTARTDPQAWHIHEDRLYLNFSQSVRRMWKDDIPGNISKAENNWPGLLSESD